MFILDLSHTSHTRARTGIQRVCLSLRRELAKNEETLAATWDPYEQAWRQLEAWEEANLGSLEPSAKRGANWPLCARLRGRLRRQARWLMGQSRPLPKKAMLVVPELFSSQAGKAFPRLMQELRGPAVAIFHDAIALKLPEHTPAGTVARMPGYLLELAQFDGVAAVSEDSRRTLLDYWNWAGLKDHPPVETIPLGVDPPLETPRADADSGARPKVLCLCSVEGRKNHASLLEAAERLWARGADFELELAGLARPDTAGSVLERIENLRRQGRPLVHRGVVSEEELERAYAGCTFTVYPSLMEGFGLPVLESLIRGKACICPANGALGETARGGGCLVVEKPGPGELAEAMGSLLNDHALRERLEAEARGRKHRNWSQHAKELSAWCRGLQPRPTRGLIPRT